MASKYWIKLYHEILDDPKMGLLPDNLWRRAIELFLLAGELDNAGQLPDTKGIAWKLRIPCNETLQNELDNLLQCNILALQSNNTWIVVHFKDRQSEVGVNERVRQFRKRQRGKAENTPPVEPEKDVTKSYLDTNTDTDTDTDTKAIATPPAESQAKSKPPKKPTGKPDLIPAYKVYADVTGKYYLNSTQIKIIGDKVGDSPPDLEKWRDVVTKWQLKGYRPIDIDGMLDWFTNGIPVYGNGVTKNGTSQNPNRQNGTHGPTGESLADKPTVDIYTGETVYPDGRRVPNNPT